MKIVKNLSKANIKNYEGFELREDLNFTDDGNYFRGFSYKGMPITTLRNGDTTYLGIRVDYLNNMFTTNEWNKTEESKLCNKYNGISEFDIDELIADIEKVIAKVAEMNEIANKEVIDIPAIKNAFINEIAYAEQVIENFKKYCKWYEISGYRLNHLIECMKGEEREIQRAKELLEIVDTMNKKAQKYFAEMLNLYGYVKLNKNGYYITEMIAASK